ncbi:MAG: LysE family translocator [Rhodobacteraceae bacterium]|nr:LysE family translocator [Paracoccaceae bacterium]
MCCYWQPNHRGRAVFTMLIALIVFLFPLAYSPGPGNVFFAANGARFGFHSTLPANLGYHIATWLVTVAIGFGFSAAMEQFPAVFPALRIAGSVYVGWLAWKIFRSGAHTNTGQARPAGFWDGVILLVFNPKAYVIIALMFTQFLLETETARVTAILLIATVFTVNNMIAFAVWAAMGDTLGRQFRSESSARKLNAVLSSVLLVVAIWMLIS